MTKDIFQVCVVSWIEMSDCIPVLGCQTWVWYEVTVWYPVLVVVTTRYHTNNSKDDCSFYYHLSVDLFANQNITQLMKRQK